MTSFSKKYSPESESHIYQQREQAGVFSPEYQHPENNQENNQKENKSDPTPFVIALPPPHATGPLHVGHSLVITIQDIMARYQRMLGRPTLRIPGTSHAGIAMQIQIEEQLKQDTRQTKDSLGREKFVAKIQEGIQKNRSTIINQIKRMGASCDRSREQYSLSPQYSRSVRKAFADLYAAGKIYQEESITNRCPTSQTAIGDIEIQYLQTRGKMYHIGYFIDTKSDSIVITTTRPETIFADIAIAVHPADKRYKKMIGKKVLIPIINKPIPVIGDEYVDMNVGTGILNLTPTHNARDFDIAKRHNLPLDVFAFDKQGNFTQHAGSNFSGKPVEQFVDNVINFLQDIGNLVKIEDHVMNVAYSDKAKAKIQPMLSKQRFVDVKHVASQASLAVRNNEINIYPETYKETLYQRFDDIKPRCISRQLRRGHRIPIRYGASGKAYALDEDYITQAHQKIGSTQPLILSMIIFNLIADGNLSPTFGSDDLIEVLLSASIIPQDGTVLDTYLQSYRHKRSADSRQYAQVQELLNITHSEISHEESIHQLIDVLEKSFAIKLEGTKYQYHFSLIIGEPLSHQEEDVLDVWFSHALWPYSVLGRPEQTPDMTHFYPHSIAQAGYDSVFHRIANMMIMGLSNTSVLPFQDIYLNGIVQDDKGRTFNKSLKNQINPLDIIQEYGADALRLGLVIHCVAGKDIQYSHDTTKHYSKGINKLRNASRYIAATHVSTSSDTGISLNDISEHIMANITQAHDFDIWILQKYNQLIDTATSGLQRHQYGEIGYEIMQTVWHDFCDRYVEISKQQQSPLTGSISIYVLGISLKLLHPYAPFVTEQIWKQLGYEGRICVSPRPTMITLSEKNYKINLLMDTISIIKNLRNEIGSKPHEQIEAFIQSGTDFRHFCEKHDQLIKHLIKASSVVYYQHGEKIPDEHMTQTLIDLTIGVKGILVIDKKTKIQQYEQELTDEKILLQTLRNSLGNPTFIANAPQELIKQKEKKLEETKQKIISLELALSKLKIS